MVLIGVCVYLTAGGGDDRCWNVTARRHMLEIDRSESLFVDEGRQAFICSLVCLQDRRPAKKKKSCPLYCQEPPSAEPAKGGGLTNSFLGEDGRREGRRIANSFAEEGGMNKKGRRLVNSFEWEGGRREGRKLIPS